MQNHFFRIDPVSQQPYKVTVKYNQSSSPLLDSTLIDCFYLTLVVENVFLSDDDDDVLLMYVKQ